MPPPPRRVTQKDVAQAAGVDRATVSLALRKHPGIPEKTRSRIEKIAAKLGYTPDPMLAALASYRNSQRPEGFHGTLAWFAETTPDYRWREVPHFASYLASAERAARRLGYKVEVFDVSKMGVSWERAAAIAQARGIRGILICPQPHADTHLDSFPWDKFSAVTFGYSLTRPRLHSVTSAHFRGVRLVMQELHQRGYRRIGLAIRPEHDSRIDHTFLAGYLTAAHLFPALTILPPCPDDAHHDGPYDEQKNSGRILQAWLKRHKPDALITGTPASFPLFGQWGIEVPADLGVACACIAMSQAGPRGNVARKKISPAWATLPADADLSGVIEDDERIGEVAVDSLVAMMHRGEHGIPEKPQRVLVAGHWHEGNSLRPLPAPAR